MVQKSKLIGVAFISALLLTACGEEKKEAEQATNTTATEAAPATNTAETAPAAISLM